MAAWAGAAELRGERACSGRCRPQRAVARTAPGQGGDAELRQAASGQRRRPRDRAHGQDAGRQVGLPLQGHHWGDVGAPRSQVWGGGMGEGGGEGLGHTLQADLWANLALDRDMWRG